MAGNPLRDIAPILDHTTAIPEVLGEEIGGNE